MASGPNAFSEPVRRPAEVVPFPAPADSAPAAPDSQDAPPPVWMQRTSVVLKFLILVWLGMIVSILPWTPLWTDNSLAMSLPKLRTVLQLNFVRGAVTGIGLIDIWTGIWEAVHYKDRR